MGMINARFAMCAAAALVLWASAGSAATIDVESFATIPAGPQDSWSNNGYTYAPAKRTAGQCFSGLCLTEFNNAGDLTTITETTGDGYFDFLGFYVNVNGMAHETHNFLKVTAT